MIAAASEEEVFEYAPETSVSRDIDPVPGSTNQDENVVEASLRVGAAFAMFDAAGLDNERRQQPCLKHTIVNERAYEAPRARLARLQRETAELRAELEAAPDAYDSASATELLHDVNALILSLERVAAGLPPRPATDGRTWDDLKLAAEAAAVAAIAGVQARAASATKSLPDTSPLAATALGGGEATAKLLEDSMTANTNLPASIVSRLAALRGLHEQGFEFAARLRAVELEQRCLRDALLSNDATASRIAGKLENLVQGLALESQKSAAGT